MMSFIWMNPYKEYDCEWAYQNIIISAAWSLCQIDQNQQYHKTNQGWEENEGAEEQDKTE